jgi:hypothetical protein
VEFSRSPTAPPAPPAPLSQQAPQPDASRPSSSSRQHEDFSILGSPLRVRDREREGEKQADQHTHHQRSQSFDQPNTAELKLLLPRRAKSSPDTVDVLENSALPEPTCPVCGKRFANITGAKQQEHVNACLDKCEAPPTRAATATASGTVLVLSETESVSLTPRGLQQSASPDVRCVCVCVCVCVCGWVGEWVCLRVGG